MNKEPRSKSGAKPTEERILAAAHREFVRHGFAGARVERIVSNAKANPRMLYHHFGGKSGLYIAVLENGLRGLRSREMTIDFAQEDAIEGLLKLFDFLHQHFRDNPDLVRLLTNENIEQAKHMKGSEAIGSMSSPLLDEIGRLLARGEEDGSVRLGINPLILYVQMVALSQFHISNMYTMSTIFNVDISDGEWRIAHHRASRLMIKSYIAVNPR